MISSRHVILFATTNFLEPRAHEDRRKPHRRRSGPVKLHISVTVFGQQDTEAEPWRLDVLGLTYPP